VALKGSGKTRLEMNFLQDEPRRHHFWRLLATPRGPLKTSAFFLELRALLTAENQLFSWLFPDFRHADSSASFLCLGFCGSFSLIHTDTLVISTLGVVHVYIMLGVCFRIRAIPRLFSWRPFLGQPPKFLGIAATSFTYHDMHTHKHTHIYHIYSPSFASLLSWGSPAWLAVTFILQSGLWSA